MQKKFIISIIIFFFYHTITISANTNDSTLNQRNKTRVYLVYTGFGTLYTSSMIGLYQLWYKDYPHSSFHFFNDSREWLQMDKAGHCFMSYYTSKAAYLAYRWAGFDYNKSALQAMLAAFIAINTIEIFDGYSKKWGASVSDILANSVGCALFGMQQYFTEKQILIPKFSFHTTLLPAYRSDVLGDTYIHQFFKDYNGQTYWLCINMSSIIKNFYIPKWFDITFGYGAYGMLGGTENPNSWNGYTMPQLERIRKYYISFDINLIRINTKSNVLKYTFHLLNWIKIPLPTIEVSKNGINFHGVYF